MPDGEAALGFLMRMGSRNAMDANRNDPNYADAVLRLADQRAWPDGVGRRAPCSQQGCNFLRHGCTAMLERALVDMVCHMIRLKLLDCARLRLLQVAGQQGEPLRPGGEARHALGVRVLGHVGAHKALARQRRGREAGQRVPRLPTPRPEAEGRVPEPRDLHSRDSLYACAPLMEICDSYGWDYIFTFKEGRTPRAYADAQELMADSPVGIGD